MPMSGCVLPPTKTQATVPVETLASMSGRRSALRTGQVAVETGAVLGLDVVAFAGTFATRAAEVHPSSHQLLTLPMPRPENISLT
jgi:hypothetical protein